MPLIRVCETSNLNPGDALQVPTTPPIAVFNVDGEFFATEDTCSHDDSSLADGYIDGDQVECAWHFAKFCLRTGRVLSPPANRDIRTYSVKVVDDEVYVEVD
ncbi:MULTISPECIES: bifunctional 3-phenylpropionate/cinnamic acid dioxygenase ferredoxin subunit [unclassified Rhodococcus (in: high G+C Gram-positive bacteria)]|uniref:Ferredoxin component of buprofezin dioxygenase n=1 Tax=Rhodococcus qingshengii TaxID=334542 RepID=A0A221J3D9_RHOSG|nr:MULTISPECIES: bifunctional 3-phenylpropionate/cinnamic acid dioxygenase ferredoxin subunit [unclassified Rhodococcus (in: high G+C Gram-positive bacteria)]AIW42796.1 buprofenzin dioxygenase ferredoxin subunit [Rhodococcus sp. YL-1]ASM60824.1 ferredoxin component of buprofezin dioxygenase [Rhodococcus qingshengii]